MRSHLRFVLTFLSTIIIALCLLCILFPSDIDDPDADLDEDHDGRLGHWLSFRDPTALFSPTATISLTDDNSTFFNAKPAAFGPLLPSYGLNGQVWVGSGFGEENANRRGMAFTMEGELGCADIPGWSDRDWSTSHRQESASLKVSSTPSKQARREGSHYSDDASPPEEEDGTDDFLHFPLSKTAIARSDRRGAIRAPIHDHADIQSLQEAAEIRGKVVMLSRGGCGFSEKIKWAQRRGATAVIVADNVPGGPLVRMYARSDIANITIPSLFTSHTTAHLLSHLIPSASSPGSPSAHAGTQASKQQSTATADAELTERLKASSTHEVDLKRDEDEDTEHFQGGFFSALGVPTREERAQPTTKGNKKPSSSDRGSAFKQWFGVTDEDEDDSSARSIKQRGRKGSGPSDGFLIGKQDWRDPDVVRVGHATGTPSSASLPTAKSTSVATPKDRLKGGSIVPGSGEYIRSGPKLVETEASHKALTGNRQSSTHAEEHGTGKGWFSWIRSHGRDQRSHVSFADSTASTTRSDSAAAVPASKTGKKKSKHDGEQHPGLWVTLTPTDMNGSPFLNTLFVLVVSPLITLAVVYSMLLLRSRIRRRRWRAPKSLVERLPVRVYQALSSRASPLLETPENGPNDTTPLLGGARPTDVPSQIRSRASSAEAGSSMPSTSHYGSLGASSAEIEKTASGLAEWRRKYGGKQKECVVCLEEYVDGISRVMSLPCGHEFHVDCITPWLTTRRRTCPICKGDVVRSLTRSSPSADESSDDEEDIQQQAAERRNPSPSAALPILESASRRNVDIERTAELPPSYTEQPGTPSSSWLSRNLNRGLDYFGVQHHDREQPPLDRNR